MQFRGLILAATASLALTTAASAQSCAENFATEGVPMLTGIVFRSHQTFPNVPPGTALDRMARAVAAAGFSRMTVEKAYGSITAFQDTTGSGREQKVRVVVRPAGKGSRVDANFEIQRGQLSSSDTVRKHMCDMITTGMRS